MAILSMLFWLPVVFGAMVVASYVGTTLALRSYFEGKRYSLSNVVAVDDPEEK